MGCSVNELARRIGITPAAVSLSVRRRREKNRGFSVNDPQLVNRFLSKP